MQLNAYVTFSGVAEEALNFYRGALGGEIELMRFEGSPMEKSVPADWKNKIMHGRLNSPAGVLMASDATPEWMSNPGDNFSLSVSLGDENAGEKIFNKLAAGGQVTMPFEKTFWASKFGMVVDKFGIRWIVNCES